MLPQFSLCKKLNLLNSLCFPCLEKLTAKFPVFPVPWPPWSYISRPCLLSLSLSEGTFFYVAWNRKINEMCLQQNVRTSDNDFMLKGFFSMIIIIHCLLARIYITKVIVGYRTLILSSTHKTGPLNLMNFLEASCS